MGCILPQTIGMRLTNEFGEGFVFERDFQPNRFAHVLDFDLISVMFQDMLPIYNSPRLNTFNSNFYLYARMRAAFHLMPANKETDDGFVFGAEMGTDFGGRHNMTRWLYWEGGVRIVPFAMTHYNVGKIMVDPNTPISFFLTNLHVGTSPFLRTGFYLGKDDYISIDFILGWQFNLNYARLPSVQGLREFGEIIIENFDPDRDILLNSEPISHKNFRLNGMQIGAGVTFYF